jgi:hypothetical protein
MSEQRRKRKEQREQGQNLRASAAGRALKKVFVAVIILLVVLGMWYLFYYRQDHKYDAFARCLSSKQVKMYGAYWCPHCTEEKEKFGSSFKNINYVECGLKGQRGMTESCKQAGIKRFPTWEFPDGQREELVLSLETLSQKTGCELP